MQAECAGAGGRGQLRVDGCACTHPSVERPKPRVVCVCARVLHLHACHACHATCMDRVVQTWHGPSQDEGHVALTRELEAHRYRASSKELVHRGEPLLRGSPRGNQERQLKPQASERDDPVCVLWLSNASQQPAE